MSETVEKTPTWRSLLAFEAATLGGGGLIAYLTRNSMPFYDTLVKPSFAPPGWLFPAAWSALYAGMAYAAWRIYRARKPRYQAALALYIIQLAVNLAWPALFFTMKALGLSFLWLVLLWALVLVLMCMAFRQDRLAGWLLTPYLGWVTFAGVLNFAIARMNP